MDKSYEFFIKCNIRHLKLGSFCDTKVLQKIFSIILVLIISIQAFAVDNVESQPTTALDKRSEPYCGLYCLYTVMKLANKDVDFTDLLKKKYIGSRKGSSLDELKQAAEDYGFYAVPVTNMTSRELRELHCPAILHVKSNETSKSYDHFELFLGVSGNRAKLINVPNPISLVPFWKLATRWDGKALIISRTPVDTAGIFASSRKRFTIHAILVVVVMSIIYWCKRKWLLSFTTMTKSRLFALSLIQASIFVFAAVIVSFLYHFINNEGFLAHANATAPIQQAHAGSFIPKIDTALVEKLLKSNAIIIDARLPKDFEAGHLEGAINVPINYNDEERLNIMGKISKDAKLVVYCQSNSCFYAEKLAAQLMADGFENIDIYGGGWNEWNLENN